MNKKFFFLNKISFKKISFYRSIIKINSFNNNYCDSLGNFLRRIIFLVNFSIKIIYIKFYNIDSEYLNLKGVKETTLEIIENIKNISIKLINSNSAYLIIKKKGPCIITAKDIFSDKKIILINPNLEIANIINKKIFFCLMKCSSNKEKNIFCNKLFKSKLIKLNYFKTPIKNINYFIYKKIFNNKIKQLFFDIETDGTIKSEDCFKNTVYYIKKYFDCLFSIISFKKIKKKKNIFLKINPTLIRSIDNLELNVKTSNFLKRNNIYLIGDLIKLSEIKLFSLKLINKIFFIEILKKLKNKNLNLNTKIKYEIQF
ncbi:MAG: DNA-directed RNA polymerase subunit alpha C-terminal domain-containing protein [Candidatus Carsonella ruddii]